MPHYISRAPHGVACIRLDNGDEALFVNGELISSCTASELYPRIIASGLNLSTALSLPFKQLRGLRANGTKTYAKKLIHCLN